MVTLGGDKSKVASIRDHVCDATLSQLSWEDALHLVQNRRYCISPNGGFLTPDQAYAL